MTNTSILAVLVTVCASLMGCSENIAASRSGPYAGGESVTAEYATGGGAFGSGAFVAAVARVKQENGRVVLCAAWTHDQLSATESRYIVDAANSVSIELDGQRLADGVYAFPKVELSNTLVGKPTNCVLTELPWDERYQSIAPTFPVSLFQARPNREVFVKFNGAKLSSLVR